ncbi:MAG: molybdenum cofactor guanylyltransferase, partial [Pseudomonadales bacterium]|nr:molybdenum cofactor guanylyltransferase [Pseudomonadales bacterium]
MPSARPYIAGVILAGGQSSRMQFHDKSLMPLGERCVIDYIIDNARKQASPLLINVNRHPERYQRFALPLIADPFGPDAGPLAGILAAMEYCQQQACGKVLACFPGDVPWFPQNLVAQLEALRMQEATQVCYACTAGQWQPLFSVWSLALLPVLRQAMAEKIYSPMMLIRSLPHSVLDLEHVLPG